MRIRFPSLSYIYKETQSIQQPVFPHRIALQRWEGTKSSTIYLKKNLILVNESHKIAISVGKNLPTQPTDGCGV